MAKKKVLYFIIWMLLTLPIAFAQSTTVSSTVVDLSGNIWTNALVTATFMPAPNTPGPYTWSGGAFNPTPAPLFTDGSGHFSMSLPSNNAIVPSGSTWQFQIAPNATLPAAIVNVGLTGGTLDIVPIITGAGAWPTIPVPGTFVNKVYNVTQVGTIPLNVGAIIYNTTLKELEFWNGTIWQPIGTGGGGGATPAGDGVMQFSTKDGSAFFAGNIFNSNAFNVSNDGQLQAQALGCNPEVAGPPKVPSNCVIFYPDFTIDTEGAQPLPVQTNKPSSIVLSTVNNTWGVFGNNPYPGDDIVSGTIFQYVEPESVVYSLPNPGAIEGGQQGFNKRLSMYLSPGFSNGNSGCPLFCPLPQYTGGISNWTVSEDDYRQVNFNTSGIREMRSNICNVYAIGDAQCGLGSTFTTISNGFVAPSDEGIYSTGSVHTQTGGDFQGTMTTIIDGNHFKVTPTVRPTSQGQGRYIRDLTHLIVGTDGNPLQLVSADLVRAPGDTFPYGTLVSNHAFFPISTARGTFTNNCTVPALLGTVAIGQNSSVNGCDITVDTTFGVGHFTTTAPVCSFYNNGNLHNLGSQVTVAPSIVGGHQTLTMTMNRSIPAGGWIYQGGLCPATMNLTGDGSFITQDGSFVDGSVFPIVGSVDAHTAIYLRYDSSQFWTSIPAPGSQWGTKDTANSIARHGFTAINLTRVGGIVTAIMTSGNQGNPPGYQMLNGTEFFTVSGCADASFNSPGVGAFGFMPGPDPSIFAYVQPGSPPDSTCANAVITMQDTTVNFMWSAEILDVTNHSPGIQAVNAIDGTFVTSYNPHFVVGATMDSPPHYEGAIIGHRWNEELATPMSQSIGIDILQGGFSAFNGPAIHIAQATDQHLLFGLGGAGISSDAIQFEGIPGNIIKTNIAPIGGRAVIDIGFPSGDWNPTNTNSSFRSYYVIGLDDAGALSSDIIKTGMFYNSDTQTWSMRYNFTPTDSFTFAPTFGESANPFKSPEFQYEEFPGDPISKIKVCSAIPPGNLTPMCYSNFITTTATISQGGTAGSTQYAYILFINDKQGPSFSGVYFTFTGNATLSGTNFNKIPCTDLPAGLTGAIYVLINPFMEFVGNCANSATVVNDTGVYGAINGNNPLTAGITYYSGGFAATGLTGEYCWTQADIWGTSTPATTPTLCMSQVSAGVMSLDTTSLHNGLGSLILNNITINGTCSGSGCGSGSGGSVTSVGIDASLVPLFTTSVTNPTTTPVIHLTLNSLANFIGVADVTIIMPTSSIAANTCTSTTSTTMAGVTTATAFAASFNSDPNSSNGWGANGGLVFAPWPTLNTINWRVCNQSTGAITPGAMSLNIGAR